MGPLLSMKLIDKMCYSRLLWIQCSGPMFGEAVNSFCVKEGPYFQYEGVAGYIETVVEFDIRDLQKFTNIYESYNSLTDKRRAELYGLAKGLGDCK